jgi:uncharacterized protein YyaL (SSP411 family)
MDSPESGVSTFIRKMMEEGKKPNRLIHEKSPYLLQHAFNPVDWYPWGEEAFAKARAEQKPIFLSVGYSTCHWCHVMEHESFENDSIATIMNRFFVCIKVDREERPDVDKVYMTALQGMGQGGGWPMSMFLTTDLKPFYGGTYFPPENRYGRIGFPDLLERIKEVWDQQRAKVLDSAEGITEYLQKASAAGSSSDSLDAALLDTCFEQLRKSYDPEFGGFGDGPKFPRPVVFNFLLRYYYRTDNREALEMVQETLRKMAGGGIRDHIGGGFHRYSVDAEWRVPHFEKMLYDQAQLASSYLELYQVTRNEVDAEVVRGILEYVLRDLTDPAGGFYSAEDADSPRPENPTEEGEGSFYLWTSKEIMNILGDENGMIFSRYFGIEEGGNALADPQHEFTGRNILYSATSLEQSASHFGKSEAELRQILEDSRIKVFRTRATRPRPHLDDKILTSWNGLMISAFARAFQIFREERFLKAGERAASFLLSSMYDSSAGTLNRRFRDGEARFAGHLDDYAFFVQGLLDLYEASFNTGWLKEAILLTSKEIEIFWDEEHGGFFDTSGRDSSILIRMKEQYDSAEPTGNSIAVMNLLRLADMTDNTDWREKAEKTIASFGMILRKQPVAMPQMAAAFDYTTGKSRQVIFVGRKNDPEIQMMLHELFSRFLPNKIVMLIDDPGPETTLAQYLPFVTNLRKVDGKPSAYVCEDYVCQLPTNDLDTFSAQLNKAGHAESR